MASSSREPWDALRKRARAIETSLDAQLTAYSKLASAAAARNRPSSSSRTRTGDHTVLSMEDGDEAEERAKVEKSIETGLEELSQVLSSLTVHLDSPFNPPSTSQMHAVQRHREVLQDYNRDFRRTRDNLRNALESQDLLGSVRGEIDAYKAAHASDQDALLSERGQIDNSHGMIDRVLDQAYATRHEFSLQSSTLSGINNRIKSTLGQLPGLNSVIGLISSRRRRDSIIMGLVIGVCTIALLGWISR